MTFSTVERQEILEGIVKAGIAPEKLMPGTSVTAIPETVALTRHALSLGVTRVVMLPPFDYKGGDDGLFAAYARIIDQRVSGSPLFLPLIGRLIEAFPDTVAGIKDSAGDFANMEALLAAFSGFSVLAGADPLLLPLVEAAQTRINAYRSPFNSYVQIRTIKAMIGLKAREPAWSQPRAPLMALNSADQADLAVSHMAALYLAGVRKSGRSDREMPDFRRWRPHTLV